MPDFGYEFYLLVFNLKIKFISMCEHVISSKLNTHPMAYDTSKRYYITTFLTLQIGLFSKYELSLQINYKLILLSLQLIN